MTSTGTCPQCGTLLFSEAAAGLCPKCLGSLGFAATPCDEADDRSVRIASLHRLGDYELLEEIARGGMGVVYKARQLGLNRIVAVKVVLHGPFSSPEFMKRFHTEATAVAALHHPNIVSIYEVGQHGTDHFFSMEYIEGKNLADLVRDKPLPAQRAASHLKAIAAAVEYAHTHGVLHRDLKPSNVLLDVFEQPRITDFGLAKFLDSDAELTTTGQVLGSPGYISPEQASGHADSFGPQSDVYSLGAILYHLLTGRPPFQGETLQEILLQVHNTDPVSPRRLNSSVPLDLQTICLKCLQKEPSRRYTSARELAEDLGRFLNHEPIHARPVGWAGRAARWCRRKPALATLLGICVLLFLIIAIGSPIALFRINRERVTAEAARQQETTSRIRAEQAEHQTQQQLYAALLEQARATVLIGEMGHRVRALDALRRAAAISNRAELRREVFAALTLPDLHFDRNLPFDESFTLRSLDPNFERVALCRGGGDVEIRSIPNGELLAVLPAATNLPVYNATEWSGDGRFLAVKRDHDNGGTHADWEIWDVTQRRRTLWLRDIAGSAVSFDAPSARLLAGQTDDQVVMWDLRSATPITRFRLPDAAWVLRLSPKADRFAAVVPVGRGARISIHNATNGQLVCSHDFNGWVPTIAWHPDGNWLAVPEYTSAVYTMNAHTGETRLLGQHKAEANTVVFSPDGSYLFTGGWEREIICWDAQALRRTFMISLQAETIKPSRNGQHYAVMTRSGLQLHRFVAPECFRTFREDLGERLLQGTFSADGRWLAASAAHGMGVWDLTAGAPGAIVRAGYGARLNLTADGSELFASRVNGDDVASFRWHIQAGETNEAPKLERLPLFRPNGFSFWTLHSNWVALTTAQGSQLLPLERAAGGSNRWLPTAPGLNKVSPDGRWLAINAPWSELVYVYKFPGFQPVARLAHGANVADFVFSPDGKELALASPKGVQFWSTSDWKPIRMLTAFTGILFQPDSKSVWLMKDFHSSGLYHRQTLEPLLPLPNGLHPLAISPDGRHLAVSADLRRLLVVDLETLRHRLHDLGMDWAD